MLENLLNVIIMQKCASLLIVAYLFVCLTFNSTLPLPKAAHEIIKYPNPKCSFNVCSLSVIRIRYIPRHIQKRLELTQRCELIERTKMKTSNLENTLRRIKDSTQDFGKNIYDHLNTGIKTLASKDSITEEEIRQYEEMVLMKKYPYVDLKALEMKYGPVPSKNTRQSAYAGDGLQNEPGIHCDAAEDLLNVEIVNRGLSGFAIPPLLTKHTESDSKLINNNVRNTNNAAEVDRFPERLSDRHVLNSLKEEINAYLERKTGE